MQEALTSGLMEIAVSIVGLVVAVIVGYLGKAAKALVDSKARRDAATALESFDSQLYDAAVRAGTLATQRFESELDEFKTFGDSDRYDLVRDTILDTINDLAHKAGFNDLMTEQQLESLVATGIAEGRRAWRDAMRE